MRILILEDDKKRQVTFKQNLIGHNVVIVETPQEAIALLESEEWEMLCLDHDLYGKVYVPSGPGTGYEVAEWLSIHKDRKPKKIFTHSFNEKGRAEILRVLPETIEAPGMWYAPTSFLIAGIMKADNGEIC